MGKDRIGRSFWALPGGGMWVEFPDGRREIWDFRRAIAIAFGGGPEHLEAPDGGLIGRLREAGAERDGAAVALLRWSAIGLHPDREETPQ